MIQFRILLLLLLIITAILSFHLVLSASASLNLTHETSNGFQMGSNTEDHRRHKHHFTSDNPSNEAVKEESELECWKARIVDSIMMAKENQDNKVDDLLVNTWIAVKSTAFKRQLTLPSKNEATILYARRSRSNTKAADGY